VTGLLKRLFQVPDAETGDMISQYPCPVDTTIQAIIATFFTESIHFNFFVLKLRHDKNK
jgi:hypothetical protein